MNRVKPGRREMYAALTRSAVLASAQELFVTNGYDGTSIDQIAGDAQTSKGAVYHHFRDKQEIFAEVFRDSQARVIDHAVAVLAHSSAPTAWERVEAATRAFVRGYAEDREAGQLLRQAMNVLGWDRVHAIDEQMSLPLIRATLTDAIESGEAVALPVEETADILLGLFCTAILVIAATPEPAAAAADAERIVVTLLGGLRIQNG
ncbi:TetR/AcrR family transcriptional regulator [Gordonia sp. ABSL1-1]|uniref:TetR/AcrR family transcriptional regulator n=1 Tax=Gordonia sp. ABSL1-1 TaxID=3053923 RepID=UPI0025734B1F|nr:TetR/AcrR family transcriptional regulator [Gordonia sp. ABSL1-1]MDL9935948.1 TetR/AcrR family transcriptional regulator [Gordonia sp. ABSL1-1]